MKRLITFLCLSVLVRASAQIYTVSSNPLWTDTGIYLNQNQIVTITATGTWSSNNSQYGPSGPDGWPLTSQYGLQVWSDGFLAGANKGVLLAYVGADPFQGHWGDSSFFPAATGYWAVGSSDEFSSPQSGELWLGFNDDAVSELTYDNSASLTATVELVPEPANGFILGAGVCILALMSRRIFNQNLKVPIK